MTSGKYLASASARAYWLAAREGHAQQGERPIHESLCDAFSPHVANF